MLSASLPIYAWPLYVGIFSKAGLGHPVAEGRHGIRNPLSVQQKLPLSTPIGNISRPMQSQCIHLPVFPRTIRACRCGCPLTRRFGHAAAAFYLLSWAEIFSFEGSYGAAAFKSAVPRLYLLVVRHGGQLIIEL